MEKRFIIEQGALKVPCRLIEPDYGDIRRVVLGVHGLGGCTTDQIQESIAEEMEMFYAATVRFDFPAHGESPMEGPDFTLDNCKNSVRLAAQWIRQNYPEVEDLCIFATGFGAYITLLCLDDILEMPGKVKLVIQTPSFLMHETLLRMARTTESAFHAAGTHTFRTARPLTVSYSLYEEMAENVALVNCPIPMLIIQSEEDKATPIHDIRQFHRMNELSRLVVIPGTTHRFTEEGAWDMVLDLTRDWFSFEQVLLSDWD